MNPHWNLQVVIGDGRRDHGAQDRAIDVAGQLLAAGRWPDHETTRLVIHDPYDVHRRLQLSGQATFNSQVCCSVYPGVYDLVAGQDYEIKPLPADFWRMHGLAADDGEAAVAEPEPATPTACADVEPAAKSLTWFWVAPWYESGYDPKTFNEADFLVRAVQQFQAKEWAHGQRPSLLAVHPRHKGLENGLRAAADHLGLTIVTSPTVSAGTYRLARSGR